MALYGDKPYGKAQEVGKKIVNNGQILKSGTEATQPRVRKQVAYDPGSGGYGIRTSVENAGLDGSKLGWDGEYVTYNGVKMKPSAVNNGSTFASQNDINNFIQRAYKSDGKNLVQANKYVNPYGLNGLEWNPNTKQVMVGGKAIDYAFSDEGNNAWVDEAVIKQAYDDYAKETGIKSDGDIFKRYAESMAGFDEQRNNVMNDKFSYTEEDLENDLAYKAYEEMHKRNAQKAHDDMLGRMAMRNGGGMSSAAQLAGAGAYNEQMQMLNDRIPEFQQMAYNRFLEERNAKLNDIATREANAYNRYITESGSNDNAYEKAEAVKQAQLERMYEPLNRKNAEIETENNIFNQAIQNGTQRGFYTDEEAIILGLRRNADGSWPSPYDAQLKYWNIVEQPALAYQYAQEALAQERQHGYDMEKRYTDEEGNGYIP